MGAQAHQAGPGLDREASFPVSLEAAGPARPRLIIEEVRTRLGDEETEVSATLTYAGRRFTGSAVCPAGERPQWELAAAASVTAIQYYLQHQSQDPSTTQVQLLDIVALTTGAGQEVIAATIRIARDRRQTDLHGSVLVRNDRSRAAVAATLDAVSRYLGRLRAPSITASPEHPWDGLTFEPALPELTLSAAANLAEPTDRPLPPPAMLPAREPAVPSRSPAGFPAIGVLISPPVIHACAVDSRGRLLAEARRPLRAGCAPEITLSLALQTMREVISGMDASGRVTGIGLAVPGELVEVDGVFAASGEFPNRSDAPFADSFASEFGLPVSFLNPTHASAYAEYSFGAARGIEDLLYVRLGAGIDAALMLGGRPALTQLSPGRAGHIVIEAGGPRCICGESGCWQAIAGREALIARVMRAIRNGAPSAVGAAVDDQAAAITPALIVRMAGSGDAVARRALEETGNALGLGLANLIALFGPQAVILDSQPAAVGAALLRAAEASLKSTPRSRLLSHCVLLSPELGESSSVIGAAAWAARNGG